MSQQPLRWRHFFERQTLARLGNKMPIKPFVMFEFVNRFSFLVRCECGKEVFGGLSHFFAGRVSQSTERKQLKRKKYLTYCWQHPRVMHDQETNLTWPKRQSQTALLERK